MQKKYVQKMYVTAADEYSLQNDRDNCLVSVRSVGATHVCRGVVAAKRLRRIDKCKQDADNGTCVLFTRLFTPHCPET